MAPNASRLGRRVFRGGLAGLLAVALSAAVAPHPAQATTTILNVATSAAYVDSRHPDTIHRHPGDDVPVGRTGDDVSRAYFTFDLSAFAGRTVSEVTASDAETAATDCTHRSVELWTTAPVTKDSSWRRQPAWRSKLSTLGHHSGEACPTPYVEWDATAAVQSAVAAGQRTLTLGLRNTDEQNPRLGRRFASTLALSIGSDAPPATPVAVSNGGAPCATGQPYAWLGSTTPQVVVKVADPDGDSADITFASWPVDNPQQRLTVTLPGSTSGTNAIATLRSGLVDGGTYGWAAQATDPNGLTSAWSATCYFHVDTTHPAQAPTISVDPAAPMAVGIPAAYTFTANGEADVAGYRYDWGGLPGGGYVAAGQIGGPASAQIAPPSEFPTLTVYSVDRAGNVSLAAATYRPAGVQRTAPLVEVQGAPRAGETLQLNISPIVTVPGYDHVVSYSYTVNSSAPTVVAADANGHASVRIPLGNGSYDISVRGTSSNGWVSPATEVNYYAENSPTVTSPDWPENGSTGAPAGQPGTFTFTNHFDGATTFYYTPDFVDIESVPVGPDGTATVTWTAGQAGSNGLFVYSETPDGTQSDWTTYSFTVG